MRHSGAKKVERLLHVWVVLEEAEIPALKQMIEAAYDFKPYLVSGGPTWLDSDRFEITAKAGVVARKVLRPLRRGLNPWSDAREARDPVP